MISRSTIKNMVEKLDAEFRNLFGSNRKRIIISSPGRVNLIGEHTDYNEGFVLPAAIDKNVFFIIAPRTDSTIRLYASDFEKGFETELKSLKPSEEKWPNYILGMVDQISKAGYSVGGFDCVFGGNIPIGAGMSSSAAIEEGVGFALNEMFKLKIEKMTLVKLGQKAENEFVGVKCGIMDQFINIYGREKTVLKIDCRTLDFEYIPFVRDDILIVLCDTKVRHELSGSEYNVRRKQCETGVSILQKHNPSIRSLRDVTIELLQEYREEFDPVIYKRCVYVVNENIRVEKGIQDLERDDFIAFGRKMIESHNGLRDDYEVSCRELDIMVDIALDSDGVYGSRMMGGGFGGCTINLVDEDKMEAFNDRILDLYHEKTGIDARIYSASIQGGTRLIERVELKER